MFEAFLDRRVRLRFARRSRDDDNSNRHRERNAVKRRDPAHLRVNEPRRVWGDGFFVGE